MALAIPIALHLFELRQPKRVAFTNVEFLREVKLVTARQRKVKHLLVLLSRIGLIISLVLLFAQPFIPAPLSAALPRNAVQVAVDVTPSMQAGVEAEQSAFELAVEQARELPAAYPASSRFKLLNNSSYSVAGAAFRSAVDQLQISGEASSMAAALAKTNSAGRNQQLFLFSDFQKSGFPRSQLQKLDSTTQVFLVPVAGVATHNVYVDSVLLNDAFVRSGTDVTLQIRVRNGGKTTAENSQVKLFVGDRQAGAFRVTVPANGQATLAARVQLTGNATQECRVEVEDYPVTFDNTFYFTLTPSPGF
ncbi:BatA domain-containing protein [Hymenobacter sp. J193]|nr:BatA domain-containing protein [Hymenobacter sp. J193]